MTVNGLDDELRTAGALDHKLMKVGTTAGWRIDVTPISLKVFENWCKTLWYSHVRQVPNYELDSQAGIKAIAKPEKQSGQVTLQAILDKVEILQSQRPLSIELVWITRHMDIHGNEITDCGSQGSRYIGLSRPRHQLIQTTTNEICINTVIESICKGELLMLWQEDSTTAKHLKIIYKRPSIDSGVCTISWTPACWAIRVKYLV